MAVPHDEGQGIASPIRGGWVEKREAQVMVGLGPLIVTGNLHFGQWESITLEAIGRNADGRAFLPATGVRVTSLYHPSWAVEAPSVFLSRAAMGYISLLLDATRTQNGAEPSYVASPSRGRARASSGLSQPPVRGLRY